MLTTRLASVTVLALVGCSAAPSPSPKQADPTTEQFATAATMFLQESKDFWSYVVVTPYGDETESKQARVEKAFKAIPQPSRDLIPVYKDCEALDTNARLAALTISMSKRIFNLKGDDAAKYSEDAWKKENAANVQEHLQQIETLRVAFKSM